MKHLKIFECDSCIHKPVCKDSTDYNKIFDTINNFEFNHLLSGVINCVNYSWGKTEVERRVPHD